MTWIDDHSLEWLSAEAEHRLDIAEANIRNALASVRARHDNFNRAYTTGLKYYSRPDIAEANIRNTLASARAKHDNLNRAYTSGLKSITSNIRRIDDYTDYYSL